MSTRLDLLGTLAAKRGITYTLTLDFKQANGQPVNLTGCTAIAQIRRKPGDPKVLNWIITIPSPTTGRMQLSLAGDDSRSQDFPAGRYLWDMIFTAANGQQQVPVSGSIELEDVISHA